MSKREAAGGVGDICRSAKDGDDWRCWEWLNPEVLALIFKRLPVDEIVRSVSFVCPGWRQAVTGPYCWSDIEMTKWCYRVEHPDFIGVRKLVRRSAGTLRRLSACRIGNRAFAYAAVNGNHLRVLEIPMSEVDDWILEKYSGLLKALQVVDISFCSKITSKGIQILGNNCRSLICLQRNLYPQDFETTQENGKAEKINEEEALAVGSSMPGLEKLDLTFGRFSDYGLDVILTKCKAIRSLNITGCWNVQLHGDVGVRCVALESFKDPYYYAYSDCWRPNKRRLRGR